MFRNPSIKIQFVFTLIIVALVSSACSGITGRGQAGDMHKVADRIAAYTLPAGYSEQFAIDLMGYQLVSLQGRTESCHIYLIQAPKDVDVDVDSLQKQAGSLNTSNHSKPRDLHAVEQRQTSIRGQEVTLLVSEGINSENQPYREANAIFTGREGPALVSIASPVSEWDWSLVEMFLSSIQ